MSNPNPGPDFSAIVHPSWTNPAGESYTVSAAEIVGTNVRQVVKAVLRQIDPETIVIYKRLKNEGRVPGQPAKLDAHRAATKYLFARFTDLTMTVPGL